MHMQASLLASAALTAEVAVLKEALEGSRKSSALLRGSSRRTRVINTPSIDEKKDTIAK